MNIRKQLVIAWVQGEKQKRPICYRPLPRADGVRLRHRAKQLEEGRAVEAWTPIVFLEPEFDTQDMRSWLEAGALRRVLS